MNTAGISDFPKSLRGLKSVLEWADDESTAASYGEIPTVTSATPACKTLPTDTCPAPVSQQYNHVNY